MSLTFSPSVMEFDLEDPLMSFGQHDSDTASDLFSSEADHMPARSSSLCISFRREAVSQILQAQFLCNFEPFMSYLAVNYLDRYASKREIPLGKPWVSRLLVIACLSLAAKMKNSLFSLSEIQREGGFVFDAETVHKMELLILDALNWRMRSITPFSFFSFFTSFLEEIVNDAQLTRLLKDRASEIIFSSQSEIKFVEFKPSIMAASALLHALSELFPLKFPSLKAVLSACEYVDSDNLWKCYTLMQENATMTMQEYGPNLNTEVLSSSIRTPVSVLEHQFTNSTAEQCASLVSEKEEKKRVRANGLCSYNTNKSNEFRTSRFDHEI